MVEMSIKFDFPFSNNQVEYEALIAGLQLVSNVSITRLTIYYDSQIIMSQVTRAYQAKDPLLQRYLTKVKKMIGKIGEYEIPHVPKEKNVGADILSKLASTMPRGSNRSLIQETLKLYL